MRFDDSTTAAEAGTVPDNLSVGGQVMLGSIEQRLFGVAAEPAMLGRFHLLEIIGRGGMGVVYKAFDPQLDRRVAVKVVKIAGGSARERLVREAKALAKLSHPNVVTLHEVGEGGDELFVAMEYVDGGTLAEWRREHPPGSRARTRAALRLALQAVEGLSAAHELGIVHRDIKPANMLLGSDGRLRIADFGLARPSAGDSTRPEEHADQSASAMLLTATGAAVGTPAYMAPEQFRGDADARSDQFGFCASFYEIFFGVRPYAGNSVPQLLDAIDHGGIERGSPTGTPEYIRRVLARGLSPAPEDRYPDIRALGRALEAGAKRRRLIVGVGATLVLGGAAAGFAWGARPEPCTDQRSRIDALLGPAVRARIVSAIEGSGRPYPEELADRMLGELDALADAWSEQRLADCRLARDPDPEISAAAAVRLNCLDDALVTIDDTLSEITTLTAQQANALPATIEFLLDSANCRKADRETFGTELGREMVARFREGLVAEGANERERARKIYEEVLARSVPGQFPGLRAEAHTRVSGLYKARGDEAPFRAHSIASLDEAENADDPELIAMHWLHVAELLPVERDSEAFELLVGRAHRLMREHEMTPHFAAQLALYEAQLRLYRGHNEQVAELVRRAIEIGEPIGHPNLPYMHSVLCHVLQVEGDLAGAAAAADASVELISRRLGEHHPDTATMRLRVADVQMWRGRDAEAVETLDRVIEVLAATPGHMTENLVRAYSSRGDAKRNVGRHDEALEDYRKGLECNDASSEPSHYHTGAIHAAIAWTYAMTERRAEALAEIDVALPYLRGEGWYDRGALFDTLLLRASLLAHLGRDAESVAEMEEVLPQLEDAFPRGSVPHMQAVAHVADIWIELGRWDEADRAVAAYLDGEPLTEAFWRGRLQAARAHAHAGSSAPAEAKRWAERALASLTEAGAGAEDIEPVRELLADLADPGADSRGPVEPAG